MAEEHAEGRAPADPAPGQLAAHGFPQSPEPENSTCSSVSLKEKAASQREGQLCPGGQPGQLALGSRATRLPRLGSRPSLPTRPPTCLPALLISGGGAQRSAAGHPSDSALGPAARLGGPRRGQGRWQCPRRVGHRGHLQAVWKFGAWGGGTLHRGLTGPQVPILLPTFNTPSSE